MTPAPKEITQLLVAWGNGDRSALDNLMPLVYEELRRLAHYYNSFPDSVPVLLLFALSFSFAPGRRRIRRLRLVPSNLAQAAMIARAASACCPHL